MLRPIDLSDKKECFLNFLLIVFLGSFQQKLLDAMTIVVVNYIIHIFRQFLLVLPWTLRVKINAWYYHVNTGKLSSKGLVVGAGRGGGCATHC